MKPHSDVAGLRVVRQPPSGGCVLKHKRTKRRLEQDGTSRLRAAVC